jgi:hypothetical protein
MRIPADLFPPETDPAKSPADQSLKPCEAAAIHERINKPDGLAIPKQEKKSRSKPANLKTEPSNQLAGHLPQNSQISANPSTIDSVPAIPQTTIASVGQAGSRPRTSSGMVVELPPQFVVPKPPASISNPIQTSELILGGQANCEPAPSARNPSEEAVLQPSYSDTDSGDEPSARGATDSEPTTQSSVGHLLPPQFSVLDPNRNRKGTANQVLLPTADGGVQPFNDRLVTIEFKGQKYVVVAMTPEEKRRRQMIANFVSIIIAIGAIAGTIWILMK